MYAELKYFEVETARRRDDYLAVEYAARRQLGVESLDQFREIAVKRFLVAALDEDLVSVAEDQGSKPVPLGFEDPGLPSGNSPTRLASMGPPADLQEAACP